MTPRRVPAGANQGNATSSLRMIVRIIIWLGAVTTAVPDRSVVWQEG
jgi:hypothetical protein